MKFENIVIESMDYYLPETILSSDDIENDLSDTYERLKLPKGRLELMTGIKERRLWVPGTKPSDLSTKAAEKLFLKSTISRNEVDLLIHASVCRDFLEPATATVVHSNLGLSKKSMCFDLSNACLGVINAIVIASQMIETGAIKNALIVSGENSGPLLDYTLKELKNNLSITRKDIKKYIANLTIGSAATAIMISSKKEDAKLKNRPTITGAIYRTDSSANHLCRGSGDNQSLMMETDSEELLKYGINLGIEAFSDYKKELNINPTDINLVLTHQVGVAHEKLSLESLELQNIKTYKTYPTLGNTGSSALPITLMKAAEEGIINPFDNVTLLGIGSGLVSIMLGVKWN
jgi:3-oxoacyl-[acyl-carrier-protein] synthase III